MAPPCTLPRLEPGRRQVRSDSLARCAPRRSDRQGPPPRGPHSSNIFRSPIRGARPTALDADDTLPAITRGSAPRPLCYLGGPARSLGRSAPRGDHYPGPYVASPAAASLPGEVVKKRYPQQVALLEVSEP